MGLWIIHCAWCDVVDYKHAPDCKRWDWAEMKCFSHLSEAEKEKLREDIAAGTQQEEGQAPDEKRSGADRRAEGSR